MKIERLAIEDVLLITPKKHGDARGFFSEVYRDDMLSMESRPVAFVQDNHVLSKQRGVLRGLHFQVPPHVQGKLVRCTRGAILDVAVDIRRGSPTFGRHVAAEISAENWRQIWVPPGFAHGYLTLEPDCEVQYKVTDYYAPDCERGVAWDDPDIGVDWGAAPETFVISDKDQRNPRLADLSTPFQYSA